MKTVAKKKNTYKNNTVIILKGPAFHFPCQVDKSTGYKDDDRKNLPYHAKDSM